MEMLSLCNMTRKYASKMKGQNAKKVVVLKALQLIQKGVIKNDSQIAVLFDEMIEG